MVKLRKEDVVAFVKGHKRAGEVTREGEEACLPYTCRDAKKVGHLCEISERFERVWRKFGREAR